MIDGGFTLENLPRLRMVWPLTALFFLVAALPTFLFLRERAPRRSEPLLYYAHQGFSRLLTTVRAIGHFRELAKFLGVFFVYSSGLMSIIAFVGVYAERTVGFTSSELIFLFLVVQVSSAGGAFAFGAIQDRLGARRTIQVSLLLWIGTCVATYLTSSKVAFWAIAVTAGLGIGSLQSASRALVGMFAPVERRVSSSASGGSSARPPTPSDRRCSGSFRRRAARSAWPSSAPRSFFRRGPPRHVPDRRAPRRGCRGGLERARLAVPSSGPVIPSRPSRGRAAVDRVIGLLCRLILAVFFRRIEVVGEGRVPHGDRDSRRVPSSWSPITSTGWSIRCSSWGRFAFPPACSARARSGRFRSWRRSATSPG